MKKILVIQQKMIGDVLISTILCEALKKMHPEADIHYLANSNTTPVILHNPFFDKVIELTKEEQTSKLAFYHFLKKIKQEHYDVVIDAYGKLESNLITLFSGASERTSFHKWYSSFFYTKTIKKRTKPKYNNSLATENRLRLVMPEELLKNTQLTPKIFLTDTEKAQAKTFLTENGIVLSKTLIMISVLGSDEKKSYPSSYMAALLDFITLQKPEVQILFNYMPNQKAEAKNIYDLTAPKTKQHIFFDVLGNSLRAFIGITSYCNALIGNEGGATNMAKALNVPTFIIFSPYIDISNWHSSSEDSQDKAVHLSEYIPYQKNENAKAKKFYQEYYLKFKPKFLQPALEKFLNKI